MDALTDGLHTRGRLLPIQPEQLQQAMESKGMQLVMAQCDLRHRPLGQNHELLLRLFEVTVQVVILGQVHEDARKASNFLSHLIASVGQPKNYKHTYSSRYLAAC